jgi:hypothetical protein
MAQGLKKQIHDMRKENKIGLVAGAGSGGS